MMKIISISLSCLTFLYGSYFISFFNDLSTFLANLKKVGLLFCLFLIAANPLKSCIHPFQRLCLKVSSDSEFTVLILREIRENKTKSISSFAPLYSLQSMSPCLEFSPVLSFIFNIFYFYTHYSSYSLS